MSTRTALYVEFGVALLLGCMAVVTLVWRDWIELVFGVDPDGGSGTLEWAIVVALAVASLSFAGLARKDWREFAAEVSVASDA